MQFGLVQEIIAILGVSVLTVALFWRLQLPAIIGYLFVGILVGPYGLGWIMDLDYASAIAEFGIILLLFTVGLEFSLPHLLAMRGEVLGIGAFQIVLTTALAAGAAWLAGLGSEAALVVGGAVAMSSTAIVIKQLSEQLELNSRHGRLAVGILLLQDLAVIPFLILIPSLAGAEEQSVALALLLAIVKGAVAVHIMVVVGRRVIRPIFREVTRARSSELFTLTVLLVSLTAAWAAHLAGLSPILGAFLAGMMIGETEFRHQVESEIRPFRDVLMGLFFITIGMLLDIGLLPVIWPWVLALTLAIIVFKALLITLLASLQRQPRGVSLRTALILAHGGEFGFVILSLAITNGLLESHAAQIMLSSLIFSMALSPMLIRYNGLLAKKAFASNHFNNRAKIAEEVETDVSTLEQHVIICGYGRIGQNIGRFLYEEGFEYFALDLDPIRVGEAREAGFRVSYGDATYREILLAAGVERARALVVSPDDPAVTLGILEHTRKLRPDMPVLVRTSDDATLDRFQQAGATEVVPETLEASLMLSFHLLLILDVPVARIVRRMRAVRADRYQILREFFPGEASLVLEDEESNRERLHTVFLPRDAYGVGRTLKELGLENFAVSVTAVRRHGVRAPQPLPETQLREGDILVLYGTPEALERGERALLSG